MGLAATQARYLGLTARKTNIEFEGQQVNQARTALANEGANLYSKLYSLSVPIPPNVTDYYTTEYSYNVAGTTFVINSYTPVSNDSYIVNVSYPAIQTVGLKSFTKGAIVQNADGTYTITPDGSAVNYILDPNTAKQDGIIDSASGKIGGYYCSYTDATNNTTYYIDREWLNEQVYPFNDIVQKYYKGDEYTTVTEDHNNCKLTFNTNGALTRIVDPSITDTELQVTGTNVQDTDAYTAAMNKYTVDQENYQKQIAEINKETEKIQSEDRSLELRLRQLDTEQQALQTELDSVKSVLDKNIEKVFKVFA